MKKKPIIEIKVNSWCKLTADEQRKAALWAVQLFADLSGMKKGVADDFEGIYP